MKNRILTVLFVGFISFSFSQDIELNYLKTKNPDLNRSALDNAVFIKDIMPDLWNNIGLPYQERVELDFMLNYFPDEGYDKIIEVTKVEISAICEGNRMTIDGPDERITSEQRALLSKVDMGTDVTVRVLFRHKYTVNDQQGTTRVGFYSVTVVPEKEAQYPGGFSVLANYLEENITRQISDEKEAMQSLPNFVEFTVNETGRVGDVEITWKSEPTEMANQIMDTFYNMPQWTPAETATGSKVKQKFKIPFISNGC